MKPGRVVYIRINPTDCLSVIDVADKAFGQTLPRGISFAQCASIALSSLLESMRVNGIIRRRTGEEFLQMMERFPSDNRVSRKRALEITNTFQLVGSDASIPAVMPETNERKLRRQRYMELVVRDNLTDTEVQELGPLIEEFQE